MKWLGDGTVDRLQANMREPDLSGTRYRSVRFIARGGMAEVWLAEDMVLQRRVALKILDAEEAPELRSRLLREAHILAALEHPGIVPVHDAGTLPDGRVFYCMKYVEGRRLDDFLASVPGIADRVRLLLRIAEPLAFAHSHGIIHRDLKPENVMVGPFGEILVMDWGLGKLVNEHSTESSAAIASADEQQRTPAAASSTNHGTVLGTPGYMAPEQLRGEVESIDQRTDIYGLGVILSVMIGSPAGGRAARRHRPILAICAKAMHTDPNQRYPAVQALTADIADFLAGSPISAYAESPVERMARLFDRHRTAVLLIAAYLVMRLLFILFSRR